MKFDELNQLKAFYSTMQIPEEDKKKRVDLALELYDVFLYILFFMDAEMRTQLDVEKIVEGISEGTVEDIKESLTLRLEDTLRGKPIEEDYIPRLVDEVVDTTLRHPEDKYYTSQERALLIAQNESNSVNNYDDFLQAKSKGFTMKQWVTEGDEKVRPEHVLVDGEKIPIDAFFMVGGEQMRYPHDPTASPDNIVNCRCTLKYT